jgi:hypothetical protein
MTEWSEVDTLLSFAVKRKGSKPPNPSEPNDSAPIFKKCRRESGPGHSVGGFRINSKLRQSDEQAGGRDI